jgi:putative nucleotidyltransferase with HDIG domain
MDSHSDGQDGLFDRLELRCPPLPQTLSDALELIHRPERLEVGPVTDIVERDPAVVARLLQTVNSAYYGLERPVSSTQRAVVLLSPVAVTGLVVGMNMLKLRSIMEGPATSCFLRLIQHNTAVAYLARHLHDELPSDAPAAASRFAGDAFTSALLHDFGKIILVYNHPEEAIALYEDGSLEREVQNPNDQELEALLFGYDHTEAGEYAARKLNFPEAVIHTIARHHTPDALVEDSPVSRMLRAVTAANRAAKAMGHAFREPIDWDACMDHPVWDLLLERDLPDLDDHRHLRDAIRIEQDSVDAYVEHLTQPSGALPAPDHSVDHGDESSSIDGSNALPPKGPTSDRHSSNGHSSNGVNTNGSSANGPSPDRPA